jgi:fructose-bisphosphate aldolase class 1
VLIGKGIVPGVKPHLKVYTLPGTNGDTVMQGLDSLAVRCKAYYSAGARFAKWRSPLVIDKEKGRPTDLAIRANMQDLARYALICQSEGLMPIVEPDVRYVGRQITVPSNNYASHSDDVINGKVCQGNIHYRKQSTLTSVCSQSCLKL